MSKSPMPTQGLCTWGVLHVDGSDLDKAATDILTHVATGEVPPGTVREPLEDFMARGRVADCTCRLIQCVCTQARAHKDGCQFKLALTCAIPIECEAHGYDVCPQCDPCTCPKEQP